MSEPLERLHLHELLTSAPRPEIAAATLIGGAVRGSQGAKCLKCGHVVRRLPKDLRGGVTIVFMENPDDLADSYYGIVCSELCRERLIRGR